MIMVLFTSRFISNLQWVIVMNDLTLKWDVISTQKNVSS